MLRKFILFLSWPCLVFAQHKVALLIGIENYESTLGALKTPISDATAVQLILKRDFGFQIDPLPDATHDEVVGKLESYVQSLGDQDELLIYYGGHGFYDQKISEGYWLPVDAGTVDRSKWLSTSQLKDFLKRVPARKVLVVSDSCFSGMLARGFEHKDLPQSDDRDRYL